MTVVQPPGDVQGPKHGPQGSSSFLEKLVIGGVLAAVAFLFLSGIAETIFEFLLVMGVVAPILSVTTALNTAIAIPAVAGSLPLLQPAFLGAGTGLVIGWLRRIGAISRSESGDLISTFVGAEFWRPGVARLLLHLGLTVIAGSLVAGFLASGGILAAGDPSAYAIGAILGGPGGGGGTIEWYAAWFAVILMAIAIAVLATIAVDLIIVAVLNAALSGAVSSLTEYGATVLVTGVREEAVFRNRVVHGAVTGAAVALVLLIFRET